MTLSIQSLPLAQALPNLHALASPDARPSTATAMDADTLQLLADAVMAHLASPADGSGRSTPVPPVQLRGATVSLPDAAAVLGGLAATLARLVQAPAGGGDPIAHDDGAAQRASEGASTQAAASSVLERGPATRQPDSQAGADADIADRSAAAGTWIRNSPFSQLLALLRQLLLKFEKMDRDASAQMVKVSREMTIMAGEKGVEKAKENLSGAIAGGVVMGAVGAAALRQSFKSTTLQTRSLDNNLRAGNRIDISVHNSGGMVKANATPSASLRPAGSNGPSPGGSAANRGARIQADRDANVAPMREVAVAQPQKAEIADAQAAHAEVMAKAQVPAANAAMLNMLAPSTNAIVTAGVGIEAEMTEAERQLALHVADVFKRVADEQQDQAQKSRDLRQAASELVESLMNLAASTSGHIIGKY